MPDEGSKPSGKKERIKLSLIIKTPRMKNIGKCREEMNKT